MRAGSSASMTFVALLAISPASYAATTYTWSVASGDWGAPASWSPTRITPAADDILVFDGALMPSANVRLVPRETFGQLQLLHGVQVTIANGSAVAGSGTISKAGTTVTGVGTSFTTELQQGDILYGNTTLATHEVVSIASNTTATVLGGTAAPSQTWSIAPKLMPAGGPGDDFVMEPGTQLTFDTQAPSLPPVSVYLPSGATARIQGRILFAGNAHKIFAADPGAIVFDAGGELEAGLGYVGNVFTAGGPANVVAFAAGSTYRHRAGSNPFALAAPNAKVQFLAGSQYVQNTNLGFSVVNRTFGDLIWDAPGFFSLVGSAASTTTMGSLTILQGGFGPGNTANLTTYQVGGNIDIRPGAALFLQPSGTGTARVLLNGASAQTVSAPGNAYLEPLSGLSLGAAGTLEVDNPAGVTTLTDLHLTGALKLTQGRLITGANTVHVDPPGSVVSAPGWVDGNLSRAILPGASTTQFPVGDAARMAPVTLAVSGVPDTAELIVRTDPGEHADATAAALNTLRSVNRTWRVTNAGLAFSSADATFGYGPADVDPGADPGAFVVGKYDAPSWGRPAIGARTATSTQALGLTSFSEFAIAEPDPVTAQPPSTCISSAHPCVAVPVVWTRADATPARGYSVTIQLSPNLALCGPGIVSAGYLAPGSGGPTFLVTPLGGGQYVVDEATLGSPCGSTGSGSLFEVHVTSGDPGGIGTVSIVSAIARDCTNNPVAISAGGSASVTIDNVAPTAIANLTATQVKLGNDGDGTTKIALGFTAPGDAATVEVYRKGYGGYPQYDENGGAPPTSPPAYPPAGWTLTGVTASGGQDEPPARDVWSYVAYTKDACGNVSGVSNLTGGTLNYHLGDVTDGLAVCAGNNQVTTADVSLLGAHYGAVLAVNDPLECLDVGPTTTNTVDGRPTTDNHLQFEDLILHAINFGEVSAPQDVARPGPAAEDRLELALPDLLLAGQRFEIPVRMQGTGIVQGLTLRLAFDPARVEFLGATAGELLARQGVPAVALSPEPGVIDVALLGTGAAITGEGDLARAEFRARIGGAPGILLASAEARDGRNRSVPLGSSAPAPVGIPSRTRVAFAAPNPSEGATVIQLEIHTRTRAELAVFDVHGRRVRSLARRTFEPGAQAVAWDGRDDAGRPAQPGLYWARLSTPDGDSSLRLVRSP